MNAFNQFSFEDVLRYGVAVVVVGAVLLAVLYSIWGGVLLITSGWKEEKVKPAINHIRHAIIGLVILMSILFIAPQLTRIVGLQYPEAILPSNIFDTIKEVSAYVFGWTSDATFGQSGIETNTIGSDFTDL